MGQRGGMALAFKYIWFKVFRVSVCLRCCLRAPSMIEWGRALWQRDVRVEPTTQRLPTIKALGFRQKPFVGSWWEPGGAVVGTGPARGGGQGQRCRVSASCSHRPSAAAPRAMACAPGRLALCGSHVRASATAVERAMACAPEVVSGVRAHPERLRYSSRAWPAQPCGLRWQGPCRRRAAA